MMHVNLREKGVRVKRGGRTGSSGRDDGNGGGVLAALLPSQPDQRRTMSSTIFCERRVVGTHDACQP